MFFSRICACLERENSPFFRAIMEVKLRKNSIEMFENTKKNMEDLLEDSIPKCWYQCHLFCKTKIQ